MKNININELSNYMNSNTVLIDVRTPNEYNTNHLNNSINMPVNNILTTIRKYEKNTRLILYCDHGRQSRMAAHLLNSMGYNNIYILNK